MDTQKAVADYRLSRWAKVLQARRDSGQSIKDFCQTSGISRNAYFYWQKKLRNLACAELTKTENHKDLVPSGWVQLNEGQPQHVNESLDIEIKGCHVTVDKQTEPELLKKVCLILRTL